MKYKCEKCNTVFDKKYMYENHINRKTPCDLTVEPDPNAEFSCIYCGRSFKRTFTLNRHYGICKMVKSKHSLVKKAEIKIREENINNQNDVNKNEGMVNNVSGDHNNITNNTTNITNITINLPSNLLPYDRQSISDLVYDIQNNEKMQLSFESLKIKIGGLLRKDKPHKIVDSILKFIHNNNLIPEGKNLFKGKGELKDMFITMQKDGWARTFLTRIIQTTMFELIKIMSLVDIDEKDEKTRKCIETLNDQKNFGCDFYETIDTSVSEFEHSKKNPEIDKLSKNEAKPEKNKMIIPKEMEKIYEKTDKKGKKEAVEKEDEDDEEEESEETMSEDSERDYDEELAISDEE